MELPPVLSPKNSQNDAKYQNSLPKYQDSLNIVTSNYRWGGAEMLGWEGRGRVADPNRCCRGWVCVDAYRVHPQPRIPLLRVNTVNVMNAVELVKIDKFNSKKLNI